MRVAEQVVELGAERANVRHHAGVRGDEGDVSGAREVRERDAARRHRRTREIPRARRERHAGQRRLQHGLRGVGDTVGEVVDGGADVVDRNRLREPEERRVDVAHERDAVLSVRHAARVASGGDGEVDLALDVVTHERARAYRHADYTNAGGAVGGALLGEDGQQLAQCRCVAAGVLGPADDLVRPQVAAEGDADIGLPLERRRVDASRRADDGDVVGVREEVAVGVARRERDEGRVLSGGVHQRAADAALARADRGGDAHRPDTDVVEDDVALAAVQHVHERQQLLEPVV